MSLLLLSLFFYFLRWNIKVIVKIIITLFVPHLHLACDVSTEPVDSPWLHFLCGRRTEVDTAVRLSYDFTGSAASTILYTNVTSRRHIARPRARAANYDCPWKCCQISYMCSLCRKPHGLVRSWKLGRLRILRTIFPDQSLESSY